MTNPSEYKHAMSRWLSNPVRIDHEGLHVGEHQVMQEWERPLMQMLANLATRNKGDILEIGYGLGICSRMLVENGIRSLTVVEAHPEIAQKARLWASTAPVPVTVVEGFWQEVLPTLETFEGIIFDTYPLLERERSRNHFDFIPVSRRHLRASGVLTYYSDETIDFRNEHLRLLLDTFQSVSLHVVKGLMPPSYCTYWKHDHMVIPCAISEA